MLSTDSILRPRDHAERRAAKHALRPRFLSIADACDYLGVGRTKFYTDILPRVRTVKVGRRNLVDLESLDEIADELLSGSAA